VVPVVEKELTRVREAALGTSAIPYLAEQRDDGAIDSNGAPGSPTPSKSLSDASQRVSRGERAGQKPEPLAESETWTDPDLLSESGVRHMRVEVQEQSGRWRIVRFRAAPPDMVQIYS
jgi:hypothetical protein